MDGFLYGKDLCHERVKGSLYLQEIPEHKKFSQQNPKQSMDFLKFTTLVLREMNDSVYMNLHTRKSEKILLKKICSGNNLERYI